MKNLKNKHASQSASYIIYGTIVLLWILYIAGVIGVLHSPEASAQTKVQNYSNPVHIPTDSTNERYIVWEKNCKGCHGNGLYVTQEGIDTGAPLSLFTQIGPKTVEEIRDVVMNGKNKMPGFKGRLSNKDISMISRYVRVKYLLWVLKEDSQDMDIILDYTRDLLREPKEAN
jgi:mono/diheme cytochrome c family protein